MLGWLGVVSIFLPSMLCEIIRPIMCTILILICFTINNYYRMPKKFRLGRLRKYHYKKPGCTLQVQHVALHLQDIGVRPSKPDRPGEEDESEHGEGMEELVLGDGSSEGNEGESEDILGPGEACESEEDEEMEEIGQGDLDEQEQVQSLIVSLPLDLLLTATAGSIQSLQNIVHHYSTLPSGTCVDEYAYTYVCMYVCMYVRTYVRMYICMYMYVCMHAWMHVCIILCVLCVCIHMYVCMYICMYVYGCMDVCMYNLMCTCVYVRIHMYVCTYICMYAWMHVYNCCMAIPQGGLMYLTMTVHS